MERNWLTHREETSREVFLALSQQLSGSAIPARELRYSRAQANGGSGAFSETGGPDRQPTREEEGNWLSGRRIFLGTKPRHWACDGPARPLRPALSQRTLEMGAGHSIRV